MNKRKYSTLTLISIGIWLGSLFLQVYIDLVLLRHTPTFFGASCIGTGYPIPLCITNQISAGAVIVLNICLIGSLVNYLWNKTNK